jgi:hypothetical protein
VTSGYQDKNHNGVKGGLLVKDKYCIDFVGLFFSFFTLYIDFSWIKD